MLNRRVSFIQYLLTAAVIVVLSIIHARYIGHYRLFNEPRFGWEIIYIAISEMFVYILRPRSGTNKLVQNFAYVLVAPIFSVFLLSIFQLLMGTPLLPRFVLLGSLIGDVLVLLLLWVITLNISKHFAFDAVVFIGKSTETENLNFFDSEKEKPFKVVKLLPFETTYEDIIEIFDDLKFDILVMDRSSQINVDHVKAASVLHSKGVRIRTLTMFFDEWLGKLPLSELEQISLLFDITENVSATYIRVRRLVDFLIAMLLSIFLLILIPIVFLINLIANRGPLFYTQTRVGKSNRLFKIYKFRTMSPNVNLSEIDEWTQIDDERVSVFGRFLRVTHLDEIPQIINIIKGDMTLVGPRPEQVKYVEGLTKKIPFYNMRHIVTPGITGWAQVKFHYAATVDETFQKIQYEFYYIRHQSLILDIKIIARTLQILWRGMGR